MSEDLIAGQVAAGVIALTAVCYTAVQTWLSVSERERGSPRLAVRLERCQDGRIRLAVENVGGSPAIALGVRLDLASADQPLPIRDSLGEGQSWQIQVQIVESKAQKIVIDYQDATGRRWRSTRRFAVLPDDVTLTGSLDERLGGVPDRVGILFSRVWTWSTGHHVGE